jgi:hypothetical protein
MIKTSSFLLTRYRLCGAFTRSRVRMRALASHGQTFAVAQTAVAAKIHKTLDVRDDVTAQIALN